MRKVYAVNCKTCTYDINSNGIGEYIKRESEVTNNKIIDVHLKKETALKNMKDVAKQNDNRNLDRIILEDAIKYEGKINGKWYTIVYSVKDCTLVEAWDS